MQHYSLTLFCPHSQQYFPLLRTLAPLPPFPPTLTHHSTPVPIQFLYYHLNHLPNLFELLTHDLKKGCFDVLFDIFLSEFRSQRQPPPLPLGFSANTDHPSEGKVLPGCGPQPGAVPVNMPVSFRSQAVQSGGELRVLSQAHSLALSKCHGFAHTILGRFTKLQHSITHLSNTRRGEFRLYKSKVKTEWTPVLDRLPGHWFN
jgi:hypothetical protein